MMTAAREMMNEKKRKERKMKTSRHPTNKMGTRKMKTQNQGDGMPQKQLLEPWCGQNLLVILCGLPG